MEGIIYAKYANGLLTFDYCLLKNRVWEIMEKSVIKTHPEQYIYLKPFSRFHVDLLLNVYTTFDSQSQWKETCRI
jgi:hypothetical protein